MKEIIIATHNDGKLKEFKYVLKKYNINCIGLSDLNFYEDIIEDGSTFEENALIKAKYIYDIYKKPVLSDDSGLCISALNNEPGIYSARYKGLETFEEKMNYILSKISSDRSAYFTCTLCLYTHDNISYFEGRLSGEIDYKITGANGFGYDPFFIPNNYNESLACLSSEEKNNISHRSEAIRKFAEYLNEKNIF